MAIRMGATNLVFETQFLAGIFQPIRIVGNELFGTQPPIKVTNPPFCVKRRLALEQIKGERLTHEHCRDHRDNSIVSLALDVCVIQPNHLHFGGLMFQPLFTQRTRAVPPLTFS